MWVTQRWQNLLHKLPHLQEEKLRSRHIQTTVMWTKFCCYTPNYSVIYECITNTKIWNIKQYQHTTDRWQDVVLLLQFQQFFVTGLLQPCQLVCVISLHCWHCRWQHRLQQSSVCWHCRWQHRLQLSSVCWHCHWQHRLQLSSVNGITSSYCQFQQFFVTGLLQLCQLVCVISLHC